MPNSSGRGGGSLARIRSGALLPLLLAFAGAAYPARVRAQPAAAAPPPAAPQTIEVTQTFNGAPFSYTITPLAARERYTIYTLRYPSPVVTADLPQNNTIPAEYYLPVGLTPGTSQARPAAICLHILAGNFELVQLLCSVLASNGVPAIWFQLPYYGERSPPGGRKMLLTNPDIFAKVLPQAVADIRRTVDLLASRTEIDPQKIGISGISMGGILAGAAVGYEPRLNRADLILAGGDLLRIVNHANETRKLHELLEQLPPDGRAALEGHIRKMDPLTYADALSRLAKDGRVLMINDDDDEVIPKDCTLKLAEAIGLPPDRMVWLDGLGHYTAMAAIGQVIDRTAAFFAEDLPAGARSEPAPAPTAPTVAPGPLQMVLAILQQASEMLFLAPAEGHCHFADLSVSVNAGGDKAYEGELRYIRGAGKRFRLEGRVPDLGTAAFGHGEFPWMAIPGKKVFVGSQSPVDVANPLAYADNQSVAKVRVVQGVVAAASLGAMSVEQWVTATQEKDTNGATVIVLTNPQDPRDMLRLTLRADGKTPDKATFAARGTHGSVTFRQWQTRTIGPDELFEPPGDLPRQDVLQDDLYRTFAALFNFAVEKAE
ncbi:MAG: hypothetical protein A3K19_30830 [Lentisphaerae bacterium RIFOXYB12_FULL_65_16]|nr:MAG: hypothetical protein A3K18_04065 [Lentisphaerae bacterium RIFOXYA12_64_32]OGV88813.1 MAG: hypothetical protein A3K19_30830 [Lentisphaerae bacterium RIFOXYB12_FULL_65_16]